jgi:hypothetical protein
MTEPPFVVHFLASMAIPVTTAMHGNAFIASYGSELTVTPEIIEAALDRLGQPPAWLRLLDDEAEQVRVWGEVRVRRGPWPEGVDRVQPGSPEWDDARVAALRAAALLPDEGQQRAAAARVREKYGVESSARSHTIATYREHR